MKLLYPVNFRIITSLDDLPKVDRPLVYYVESRSENLDIEALSLLVQAYHESREYWEPQTSFNQFNRFYNQIQAPTMRTRDYLLDNNINCISNAMGRIFVAGRKIRSDLISDLPLLCVAASLILKVVGEKIWKLHESNYVALNQSIQQWLDCNRYPVGGAIFSLIDKHDEFGAELTTVKLDLYPHFSAFSAPALTIHVEFLVDRANGTLNVNMSQTLQKLFDDVLGFNARFDECKRRLLNFAERL